MYQTVSVLSQEIELDRPREAAEKQVSFKLKGDLSNSRKDVNTALRWSAQRSHSLDSQSPGGLPGGSGTGAGTGAWTA